MYLSMIIFKVTIGELNVFNYSVLRYDFTFEIKQSKIQLLLQEIIVVAILYKSAIS